MGRLRNRSDIPGLRLTVIRQKGETLFFSIITGKYLPECYHLGMRAAGFVLVGGFSSRMGRDKARLRWNSRLLLEDVAAKVRTATGNVTLIGPPERYADLGLACVPDIRRHLGPLAGIESALLSGRASWNLVVACDMPNLDEHWLSRLVSEGGNTDAQCVVTRDVTGRIHPLCALYRSDCLPIVRRALDENRLRLIDLIKELRSVTFDLGSILQNINTPEEWACWQSTRSFS